MGIVVAGWSWSSDLKVQNFSPVDEVMEDFMSYQHSFADLFLPEIVERYGFLAVLYWNRQQRDL